MHDHDTGIDCERCDENISHSFSHAQVIIGAGSVVNTAYLKPNGPVKFAQDKSIIVDRCMQAAPALFAAGDIAKYGRITSICCIFSLPGFLFHCWITSWCALSIGVMRRRRDAVLPRT